MFVGSELHSFVLEATVIRFLNCIGMRAKVQGTDTYCYRERKFQGAKVPPMVLSLLGAKVRGNKSSIILWKQADSQHKSVGLV